MNKNFENGIIKTIPKLWTKEMEEEVLDLRNQGFSSKEISLDVGRSQISVSTKLKRLTKARDTYNKKHRDDKYEHNQKFLDYIKPKTILDVYAGNSFYKDKIAVITNDKDKCFVCDYQLDAFTLLCQLNIDKTYFDVIDLDPYGSAIEEFNLAIRLAKKGIVITLGEMGHKRWKRLDFVRKWYGIERMEDFKVDFLIKILQKIGLQHKKELRVIFKREYNLIARVYFEIIPYKTTEQWELK